MRNKRKRNNFHHLLPLMTILGLLIFSMSPVSARAKPKVLVFCKTAGFHHNSIAVGTIAIQKLGAENKFDVDTTTDSEKFNPENLKKYKAVIFLSTTGNVLNDSQQDAFEKYIRRGGGFMGIHAATDCEYDWPWYGSLVGAYFGYHPAQQVATLNIVDPNNISTKHLPNPWIRKDEWYSFKWMAQGLHELITIDEKSYDLGKHVPMGHHPMAWYHEYDGGRSFYTELGHTDESYADPLYLKHILGGIEYAMGNSPK
jgi:type 1 glutamine amidotransferase